MKRFSLFFTLCILFTSCETELNEMSGTSTTDAKYFANFNSARQAHFKGLEVQLPEGYPTNLLEFTPGTLKILLLIELQKMYTK